VSKPVAGNERDRHRDRDGYFLQEFEHVFVILQACKKNNSLLYGAIEAAGLKAAADMKKVGKKGEHYGSVVLLNCRNLLEPRILESHVGKKPTLPLLSTYTFFAEILLRGCFC
jgi:hypothetical protein